MGELHPRVKQKGTIDPGTIDSRGQLTQDAPMANSKTGPKPRPPAELRSSAMTVQWTAQELAEVVQAAEARSQPRSAFVRAVALQAARYVNKRSTGQEGGT